MPPYGDRFREGEVVLIHFNDKPTLYARIENLRPDHKKAWWQLTFLLLTIPPQSLTWILDEDQVRGAEFTMQGNPIRIERVKAPLASEKTTFDIEKQASKKKTTNHDNNVVSMFEDEE
jgi:hypothetical protein